ncbi:hypothetical protein ACGFIX_19345 [Nocardia salmonicida]|uniref:hypothetical protein n=1 Tax=Nocardia salmonicida TaxID=53431 RepID=UPI003711D676
MAKVCGVGTVAPSRYRRRQIFEALDFTAGPGNALHFHLVLCRPDRSDAVEEGRRRFDSSAGHIEDGNAGDMGTFSGRLVVEADFALG